MKRGIEHWMPVLLLAGWGGLLLFFAVSGRIAGLLHPVFWPGVWATGAVLMLLALVAAFDPGEECCEHCCSHAATRPMAGKLLSFLLLLLPLGVAFWSPKGGFGAVAITNREGASGDMLPESGTNEAFIPKTASGAIDASVLDLLYAAQDASLRSDFEGKTVEVVGQLMKERPAAGGGWKVVRMFMTCCAADARPVSVPLKFEEVSKPTPPEMVWVRILGTPAFVETAEKSTSPTTRTKALLNVKSIEITDPPQEAMLY
jgi:uncharacterized repeat protein (TIGR03943 family)